MRVALVSDLSLDTLAVTSSTASWSEPRETETAAVEELLVALPVTLDGETLRIEVTGLVDDARLAFGEGTAVVRAGETVDITVVLVPLPCGVWCTEGATRCEGDGTRTCARLDDGCFEWDPVVPCSSDTPACALGVCTDTCVDECADGETRCDGPDGAARCGQFDADECLEWSPPEPCAGETTCSAGACRDTCVSECTDGETQCNGAGTSVCADLNRDGCFEWGPARPCGTGESCQAGACAPVESCVDECEANLCVGLSLAECGNFDLDPCLEPSPGVSCIPVNLCDVGRCTPEGCDASPRVCDAPPETRCSDDASALLTFTATGTCSEGACTYDATETACPFGCEAGACLGGCERIVCDAPPPSRCSGTTRVSFADTGSCSEGECTYARSTTECTAVCVDGECAACAPESCNTPPEPACLDDDTLTTYSNGTCTLDGCQYEPLNSECPFGCEAGACVAGPCDPAAMPAGNFPISLNARIDPSPRGAWGNQDTLWLTYATDEAGSTRNRDARLRTVRCDGTLGEEATVSDTPGAIEVPRSISVSDDEVVVAYEDTRGPNTVSTLRIFNARGEAVSTALQLWFSGMGSSWPQVGPEDAGLRVTGVTGDRIFSRWLLFRSDGSGWSALAESYPYAGEGPYRHVQVDLGAQWQVWEQPGDVRTSVVAVEFDEPWEAGDPFVVDAEARAPSLDGSLLTYSTNRAGSLDDVHLRNLDTSTHVTIGSSSVRDDYSVVRGSPDNFLVAWISNAGELRYVRGREAGGEFVLSAPESVAEVGYEYEHALEVVALPNGGFFLCWLNAPRGENNGLYGRFVQP
ncbi:MAG: hypothetical protein AAF411_25150 [Myxococcota bacterium]